MEDVLVVDANETDDNEKLNVDNSDQNLNLSYENDFAKTQIKLLHQKHLANAFFNTSVALFVFMFAVLLANIVSAVMLGILFMAYVIFLLATTVFTLGMVFLIDGYADLWKNIDKIGSGGTYFLELMSKIYVIFPFISVIAISFSVASIVVFSLCKQHRSIPKIVISSILAALMIAIFIVVLVGGVA